MPVKQRELSKEFIGKSQNRSQARFFSATGASVQYLERAFWKAIVQQVKLL